jgi:enoyl-CoA hydratase/carnithine racemase
VGVLLTGRREGWVLLTLHRPERKNALSVELRDAVSDELDRLGEDERVHGVAITGSDGIFSSGFDLTEFEAAGEDRERAAEIWASSDRFHHTLLTFPLPLVAAVNGKALAGGCDLAVCCDVRIASTTASFAHPEFQWADVVYSPLESIVGGAVARDLLLTGRPIDATTALQFGLVTEVVAPDDLPAALGATMERIAAAPRDALARTKAKAIARAGIALSPTLAL